MGGISHRRPALQDGGDHALRTGGDGSAVDHQIQIISTAGHTVGINQLQHNIAAILIEDRHIRRNGWVLVRPTVGAGDTDGAAVQRQIRHRHYAAGLRLWCGPVKDQGATA
ncbi:Uncharacterised protein [Yersinia aleksiciae]|uniref:Uncharacterized protein n=1 Tax=Yersinia aleksiciae TaxID=263819 RepID=A0A0T9V1V4_YERAE|nr:Uncharacterised protein [Yersinia aleksiciae]CNL96593.1 Uncharacterised protein [Yersinia aleksiciae]